MWWKFRKKENSTKSFSTDNVEIRESGRAPLTEVARKVKQVEIVAKKKTSQQLMGQYKSRFRGQGMQFADFRVYQYGDDIRHIDWRTSARSQQTYVKTYEEERELNIFFVVDLSKSLFFGSKENTKREILSLTLASIGFSAIANNDRVGLILFTDKVERYVPPKKGKKHVLRILDELLTFQPKNCESKVDNILHFLSGVAKNNSVILFASDFHFPLSQNKLNILGNKHDLIAMHISDPREKEIPSMGLIELEDLETGESILIDSSSKWIQEMLPKVINREFDDLQKKLRTAGAALLPLNTAEDPMTSIHRFFYARKRGR